MTFHIHPSSIFFWGLVILSRSGSSLLPTVAAAILHECGHLLPALLFRIPIRAITLWPFGADIALGEMHGGRAIAVTAGGCLINFAAGVLTRALFPAFSAACFALGAVNLMPVRSLDGGGILERLLEDRLLPSRLECVMRTVSLITLTVMWIASIYLLLYASGQYSLFFICVFLFAALFLHDT